MGKKPLTKRQVSRIVFLRERGYSLPEIKRITSHGYGTVFRYIRKVEILPKFRKLWKNKRRSSVARMIKDQQQAAKEAKAIIKNLTRKQKILIGIVLYWAEGSKGDSNLSNTDPDLIKIFIKCIKELGIGKDNLSMSLRIYEDIDKEEACSYWSRITGIPKERIIYIDVRKGKKKGKLKYGMCRIRIIKGGYFLKLSSAIIQELKNNFYRPHSSTDRTGDS